MRFSIAYSDLVAMICRCYSVALRARSELLELLCSENVSSEGVAAAEKERKREPSPSPPNALFLLLFAQGLRTLALHLRPSTHSRGANKKPVAFQRAKRRAEVYFFFETPTVFPRRPVVLVCGHLKAPSVCSIVQVRREDVRADHERAAPSMYEGRGGCGSS